MNRLTLLGGGGATGGATAALSYIGTTQNTAGAGVATFTNHAIGTASADRVVVVQAAANANSGISSVTIGGVTANIACNNNDTQTAAAGIFWLVVTSGTTATIVVTTSGAAPAGMEISVYTLTGLTNPIARSSRANSVTSGSASVSLPVPAGGIAGAIFACVDASSGSAGAFTWGGGLTTDADATGQTANERFSAVSTALAGQSDPLSITANNSNTNRTLAAAVISERQSETTPTVVQCKASATDANQTAVTMTGTPADGNLLVAFCPHFGNGATTNTGAGWIELDRANGSRDGKLCCYKIASSETTTQTPLSTGTGGGSITVFEIANFSDLERSYPANGFMDKVFGAVDQTANTTYAHNEVSVADHSLIIGIVENNANTTQPTSITNATGTDATSAASNRAVTAFHTNVASAGTTAITANFAASQTIVYESIIIKPLQR